MGGFITLFRLAWPFLNEVVFGNKSIRDFIKEHKWVFGNLVCSLVLFLLFVNQYLINVQENLTDVTDVHGLNIKIIDLTNRNAWQEEKIKYQITAIETLAIDNRKLTMSCKPKVLSPAVKEKPHDLVDPSIRDKLEKLQRQSSDNE